jgi:hypothetical protein
MQFDFTGHIWKKICGISSSAEIEYLLYSLQFLTSIYIFGNFVDIRGRIAKWNLDRSFKSKYTVQGAYDDKRTERIEQKSPGFINCFSLSEFIYLVGVEVGRKGKERSWR